MTYKEIHKIKRNLLIFIIILILMHNFKLILNTRNKPFFPIIIQNKRQFSQNKAKNENIAKSAIYAGEYSGDSASFLGVLPRVREYYKHIQNISTSKVNARVLEINGSVKSFINGLKVLMTLLINSLKHRFFILKNFAVIMREKLIWLLEENFSSREATLGKAFVFADLSSAPESIYHSFKVIGILHLVAASSANIYLILDFFQPLFFLLEYLFNHKWLCFGKIVLVITYFILINGHFNLIDSSPSILRASLSVILILAAASLFNLAFNRLNVLLLVGILCLLINPLYIQSLGFQLSFLASYIILFYWPFVQKKLGKSSIILNSLIQILMWPVLLFYFSDINLIAIPANIIVTPLVEFLTVLYFLFIFLKNLRLAFLPDFIGSLIYKACNIFFQLLASLEKLPAKSIQIDDYKYWIIGALFLIHLVLMCLIWRDKKLTNQKNKYRIFTKWANWNQ